VDIFIPLQGPSGVRPKAPAVGAWQSPGYTGIEPAAHPGAWIGMRTDGLVVIDIDCGCPKVNGEKPEVCQTPEVMRSNANYWAAIDADAAKGWVRKTPHGMHFIYLQTAEEGTPDAPAAGVWPGIDIRAGRTSQIVFYAPGYKDLTAQHKMRLFDPRWLPSNFGVQQDRSNDEAWSEMPDGRGNNTMAAFAGAFRKQGMAPVQIAKCLGAINRICMTDDPMPIEMIVEIARSVGRYSPRPDVDIEIEE